MKDNNNKILLIFSSFLPYHFDKAEEISDLANFLTISSFEKDYLSIQKANSRQIKNHKILYPDQIVELIPFLKKQIRLFLEILLRKEKKIFIGIGGNIRSYHPAIFLGVIIKRFFFTKVFLMFDTNYTDRSRNVYKEFFKSFFLIPFSGALCSSPQSAEYLDFLGFKRKPKTTYGLNTFNPNRFRKMAQPKEEPNQFLFVGRMSEEKNIDFLLQVYSDYSESLKEEALPLKIIGDGPLQKDLVERAKILNLDEKIFLGTKNSDEISKELSNSKALLLPSFTESWSLTVGEAVSMSVPVIMSDKVNSKSFLVRQLVNGLHIEPDNKEGWVRALVKITSDSSFYRSLKIAPKSSEKYINVKSFRKAILALSE